MSRPARTPSRVLRPFHAVGRFVAGILVALRPGILQAVMGLGVVCAVIYRVIGPEAAWLFFGGVLLADAAAPTPPVPPSPPPAS